MNQLLKAALFVFATHPVTAQITVQVSGQIVDYATHGKIYLGNGELLMPLELSDEGLFTAEVNAQSLPSFVSFNTLSPKGKIERLLPRIWFESNRVAISVNLTERTFETQVLQPDQEISEQIEQLSGKAQREFILNNPNHWPSLFFAHRLRNDFEVAEIKAFLKDMNDAFRNSYYYLRLENYVNAKRLPPLKKGKKVALFGLPDKDGNEVLVAPADGKTRLIALYSSGCSYSVASIDLLAQLHELKDGNLEIISIWEDSNRDTWLNAHSEQKEKITWTNIWDEYGFAATYLDNRLSPSFYVVSAEGVLLDKFYGYSKKTARKISALVQ
jgi:hypothetical protein